MSIKVTYTLMIFNTEIYSCRRKDAMKRLLDRKEEQRVKREVRYIFY
jgi:hypothetical protein